ERTVEFLQSCVAHGIDCIQARGDRHIGDIVQSYWDRHGRGLRWIAQSVGGVDGTEKCIRRVAELGAIGCYIHGGLTEQLTDFESRTIARVADWLALIKDLGMTAGIACHNPEVLRIAEEQDCGAEFYMQTINPVAYFAAADTDLVARTIRDCPRPVLAFKILAAGRVEPREAFAFALERIKPTDGVIVGMSRFEEIEENARLVTELVTGERVWSEWVGGWVRGNATYEWEPAS
ncbi:MAG: hypothetical protein JSV65_13790, partial [Armatimonadota bacterium]